MPGDLSVEALTNYIRNAAVTYWHQTCTAKMGHDPMAVVDASLKVHGIEGLRVADGSVLPPPAHGQYAGSLRRHR